MRATLSKFLFMIAVLLVGISTESNTASFPLPSPDDNPGVLVGAGDIADCSGISGAEATAKLIEQIPGTVMAIGDLAYPDGTKDPELKPLWQALYDENVDVVVNGHDHDYEHFAPQTPEAQPDAKRGIREFIVGTGGKNQRLFAAPQSNSEVRNNDAFGVLKLTLHSNGYDWQFIPVAGKAFTDSGSGTCH